MAPKNEVILDLSYVGGKTIMATTSKVSQASPKVEVMKEKKVRAEVAKDIEAGERMPLLGPRKPQLKLKRPLAQIDPSLVFLVVILVAGSMIGMYLLFHDERQLDFHIPLRLIERDNLLSLPNKELFPVHQLSELILTESFLGECKDKTQCLSIIDNVDLPFNFLVGGDGNMYEVRGWDYLTNISETAKRDRAFVIGFMGDYAKKSHPADNLELVQAFAAEAIRRKRLVSDFKVYGLKSAAAAAGGGSTAAAAQTGAAYGEDAGGLFKGLYVWPHWSGLIETA